MSRHVVMVLSLILFFGSAAVHAQAPQTASCQQTPYPTCDGDCPPGEECVADPSGGEFCACAPPCEELSGSQPAECLDVGACPAGSFCWWDGLGQACICEELDCDLSPFPACEGSCPGLLTCVPIPGFGCQCLDVICGQSPDPECEGICPSLEEICVPDNTGNGCFCAPAPCELGSYPTCDGPCPPGSTCITDPTGDPICICEEECEQTPYPTCDGTCPEGTVCVPPDAGPEICSCEDRVCQNSPFPTCGGSCPAATECVAGASSCVCKPLCSQSPSPTCDGTCPEGTACAVRPFGPPICTCQELDCEDSPFPTCDGSCPVGWDCIPDPLGGQACQCEQLECELNPYPTCDAPCPPGYVCTPDPVTETLTINFPGPGEYLISLPRVIESPRITNAQELAVALIASGLRPGSVSRFDTTTNTWEEYIPPTPGPGFDIDPLDGLGYRVVLAPPLGSLVLTGLDSTSPVQLPGPGGSLSGTHIISLPFSWPLRDAQDLIDEIGPSAISVAYLDPNTGGFVSYVPGSGTAFSIIPGVGYLVQVNSDTSYEPSAMICACAETPCEQSEFPSCDGGCPPGSACVSDTGTDSCICESYVCEDSPFPTCDGLCQVGTICIPNPQTGQDCVCGTPCEDTFFPECDGGCPPGQECVNRQGTDDCECVPAGRECMEAFAPVCDGGCPPDERCVDHVVDCGCEPCGQVTPGVVKGLHWLDKVGFRWSPLPCAESYNVYRYTGARMNDLDGDGVADDYGQCLLPPSLIPERIDFNDPLPGLCNFYLVTGKNSIGEGSLGFTSNVQERLNLHPCP